VRKWFTRFKADGWQGFNLENQERLSRSSTTDEDQIKTLIENNATCKLIEMLNMSKSTIHERFVKLGYINRFDVWIPHDLTEKNLMDRICDSLYK